MEEAALEIQRLKALAVLEDELRRRGFLQIAGVDEAGRGPLAGPVVAAACILPEGLFIEGMNDSKQLTSEKREEIYQKLIDHPEVCYGVGVVDAIIIDQINILQATFKAMVAAVAKLKKKPDYILVDGNKTPFAKIPSEPIIDGDAKCLSIAAASVLAKETRDRMMREFDLTWPEYGFKSHKGYGTPQHLEALEKHGPCPIHRLTFDPLRSKYIKTMKQQELNLI
jgi:ribonuclease HII